MAATPYEQVMEEMFRGREFAAQLQGLLRDSPEAGRIVDQILHAFSRAIDATKAATAAEEGSEVQSEVTCGGGKRKASAGGGGDKRPACRRRAQQSSAAMVTMKDLEDGHAWRKYGQKEIQNSKHPKAYFRCTHKYDQQCAAQRQVQRCDDDPDTFRVTYIGVHTCRDPATAVTPVVLHATSAADGLHAGSRLISFAPNASTATTSTTTTATANTSNQAGAQNGAVPLRPLKLEGSDQEEVLSSLTPAGSSAAAAEATRNAAATPGPDQGDVTSGLQLCYDGAFDIASLMYDDVINFEDLFSF